MTHLVPNRSFIRFFAGLISNKWTLSKSINIELSERIRKKMSCFIMYGCSGELFSIIQLQLKKMSQKP